MSLVSVTLRISIAVKQTRAKPVPCTRCNSTPWRREAHLAISLRTHGDTRGRQIHGVQHGQWLLCLHRRRGLVSSAAARREALHVAAVQPAATRATLSGATIKCNSSSSPAILVSFGRIDNLDEALNLAEFRIACGVHFLHSSNVHKGAQHVPEDRNIGAHQTCWEEIVEDPAALQSPANSAEDTDWKRHSADHTERRLGVLMHQMSCQVPPPSRWPKACRIPPYPATMSDPVSRSRHSPFKVPRTAECQSVEPSSSGHRPIVESN